MLCCDKHEGMNDRVWGRSSDLHWWPSKKLRVMLMEMVNLDELNGYLKILLSKMSLTLWVTNANNHILIYLAFLMYQIWIYFIFLFFLTGCQPNVNPLPFSSSFGLAMVTWQPVLVPTEKPVGLSNWKAEGLIFT